MAGEPWRVWIESPSNIAKPETATTPLTRTPDGERTIAPVSATTADAGRRHTSNNAKNCRLRMSNYASPQSADCNVHRYYPVSSQKFMCVSYFGHHRAGQPIRDYQQGEPPFWTAGEFGMLVEDCHSPPQSGESFGSTADFSTLSFVMRSGRMLKGVGHDFSVTNVCVSAVREFGVTRNARSYSREC